VRNASRLVTLAAGLALVAAAPASAHHHHHGVDVDVIASRLDNPRHVAVSRDGDVYVAEAGRGGDPKTATSCFTSAEGASCTGATGAVTRVDRRGQKRIVTGLASFALANGNAAIGPHGVFADGDDVYVTNGGPTGPTRGTSPDVVLRDPTLVSEDPVSALYGTLLKIKRHGGVRQIADLWRFENEHNPDAQDGNPLVDSNPVDVYADDGRFYVADAGGNSILRVGRFGGIRPVRIFPNITMPHPFLPPPATVPMQAVPTGVVKGPDGALYVSQLTGFPFPVGGAQVFRLDPRTGVPEAYTKPGFTNAMDLAFGKDGTLYVLEIDHDSLLGDSHEGALYAVPRRSRTPRQIELPEGTLIEPGGLAVGRNGDLFVSNHATEAGAGEVLRIDLD
jgi:hypothetical protein